MWTVFKKEKKKKKNSVNWDFRVCYYWSDCSSQVQAKDLSSSPWTSKPPSKLVKYYILSHREHIFPVTCNTCSETWMRRGSSCAAQYPPPREHQTGPEEELVQGHTFAHCCWLVELGMWWSPLTHFIRKEVSSWEFFFLHIFDFLQYLNTFFGVRVGGLGGWGVRPERD